MALSSTANFETANNEEVLPQKCYFKLNLITKFTKDRKKPRIVNFVTHYQTTNMK